MGDFVRLQISPHVSVKEFRCPCGSCSSDFATLVVDPGVVALFEIIRLALGRPLPIFSGYRCPLHNLTLGGAKDSCHLTGSAIDFYDDKSEITQDYLSNLSKLVGPGGLGIYNKEGHFHIDCGHLLGLTPYRRWRGVLK
jgi:uncharacterized protein YcbK (DUF882 family)